MVYLFVLGYFWIAFVITCIIYKTENQRDMPVATILGLLWPFVVPIAIVGGLFTLWEWAVTKICDR